MLVRNGPVMKLEEKLQKISVKSQRRMDRVGFTLGLLLLIASFTSYYVLEAYGQELFSLNCPENAYHGIDKQGNAACRDILSNKIVEPIATIANPEKAVVVDSGREIFTGTSAPETILNEEPTDFSVIGILGLIGTTAALGFVGRKNIASAFSQLKGWDDIQKDQVRTSQYGRCNICYRKPTKWVYDHIDGNKKNNDISNCQGLCPECKSERNMIKI